MRRMFTAGVALFACQGVPAHAVNVPVAAKKLVVVDRLAKSGRAKVVYVAKDPAIAKGSATGDDQITAHFQMTYGSGNAAGEFTLPLGAFDGTAGWVTNDERGAKYLNAGAPAAPTEAKVVVVKPGKLLKVVGKGLGDVPLAIFRYGGNPGVAGLHTALCVTNGGEETCHCSTFMDCEYKLFGNYFTTGYLGAKLLCRNGTPDAACEALTPPSPCLSDTGLTVVDTCNNLEWEKKDGADGTPGSGTPDPGNLHDVDNMYSWAGRCSLDTSVRCQPNAAAAATCDAQTNGADGCAECRPAEGVCGVFGIATIWDWVNQVNAESFAGHDDWRIATSRGTTSRPSVDPYEAESILDEVYGDCAGDSGPCIDPVFGPTAVGIYYLTGTTVVATSPDSCWSVDQRSIYLRYTSKTGLGWIRAVRSAP